MTADQSIPDHSMVISTRQDANGWHVTPWFIRPDGTLDTDFDELGPYVLKRDAFDAVLDVFETARLHQDDS